ncbi:hypothetical protein CC79DRAFT_1370256 [Sarocladium strictum]
MAPERRSRGRTRILNACGRCRTKKIRCSGVVPCSGCIESASQCVLDKAEKKVMVSERYLQDLISQTSRRQRAQGIAATQVNQPSSNHVNQHEKANDEPLSGAHCASDSFVGSPPPAEDALPQVLNPLTSSETPFTTDSSGRQRYLGSSSSLSFSWQIRCFLQRIVGERMFINLVPRSEEQTYIMASPTVRAALSSENAAGDDLPSREYAKYLAETTLFHLGQLYHIFDRNSFMASLDTFYDNDRRMTPENKLWFIQLLLTIAFGKLFLRKPLSALGPPGASDFLSALKMQSDMLDYWDDPLTWVENLCLISIYLNTADMRASAYSFIGYAMRIALAIGMNRELPEGSLDDSEYKRRRRVWWTIFIIDRKLNVVIGAPLSIHDEDVDISTPDELDLGVSNKSLNLHIKLAVLEGRVMSTAYRINGRVDKAFIRGIENVFLTMVKLTEGFQGNLSIDTENPRNISRTAATLHIMYYQCTIIAIRPIIFVALKQKLAPRVNGPSIVKAMSEPVTALLKTCVGAATKIIRILEALHSQDMIEPFLPFDLQAVFSAGFVIILITIAYPSVSTDDECIKKSDEILAWMWSKGNIPASSRRQDLAELKAAAELINSQQAEVSPNMTMPLFDTATWLWDALRINNEAVYQDQGMTPTIDLTGDFSDYSGMQEDSWQQWFWN